MTTHDISSSRSAFDNPTRCSDGVDIIYMSSVIWGGRWLLGGFIMFSVAIAAAVAFFFLPVTYKSEASLAIRDRHGSLSMLDSLAGGLPFSLSGMGDSSRVDVMGFLASNRLKEALIDKYDLLPVLYSDIWDADARKWTVGNPKDIPTPVLALQEDAFADIYGVFKDDELNQIRIWWISEDPEFAALMLGRIIDELKHYLDTDYEFDAKRERILIEQQIARIVESLGYWERQVPNEQVSMSTITRERQAAAEAYKELRKQFEIAQVAEAKEQITFKVLDNPYVPAKKHRPKRGVILASTLVGSFIVGMLALFVAEGIRRRMRQRCAD